MRYQSRSSMYIRSLIPWDFAELAEAVLIDAYMLRPLDKTMQNSIHTYGTLEGAFSFFYIREKKLQRKHRIGIKTINVDPELMSLKIPVGSHTFAKIDHEIISTSILLPSADSRGAVVNYKRKYVHKVLVNRLAKLGQEKTYG